MDSVPAHKAVLLLLFAPADRRFMKGVGADAGNIVYEAARNIGRQAVCLHRKTMLFQSFNERVN